MPGLIGPRSQRERRRVLEGPCVPAGHHLVVYDPRNEVGTMIGTCFGTHHLMFAEDGNNTL